MNKIHFKLTLLKNKLIFSENFLYKILFIGSFMFMPFMLYKNEIIYYSITNSIEARFTLITMIGLLINKILIKSPKIKSKKNIFKLLINSVWKNLILLLSFKWLYNINMVESLIYIIIYLIIIFLFIIQVVFFNNKKNIIYIVIMLEVLISSLYLTKYNLIYTFFALLILLICILCFEIFKKISQKTINNPFILETKIHWVLCVGIIILFLPIYDINTKWIASKLPFLVDLIKSIDIPYGIYCLFTLFFAEKIISFDLNKYKKFLYLNTWFLEKNQLFWIFIWNVYSFIFMLFHNINLYEITLSNLFIILSIIISKLFKLGENITILIMLLISLLMSIILK